MCEPAQAARGNLAKPARQVLGSLARSRKEAGPKAAQRALPLRKVVEQVGSDPT